MRITTLTLKNFRSHVETVLELDRFNFIRGPNGCGKSSIQLALEFLFTGRCAMTDAAGRGAEALIRAGEKELQISATLENGDSICRRRTPRSHIVEINGNRVPVDAAQTSLEKRFGSADILSAVLNGCRFLDMSDAEQKRLLAQVIDAGKIDISEEIGNALRTLNEEQPRVATVSDVEAAYKRFYDLRTEASRTLKALGQMERPHSPPDLPAVPEIRKKLEDLRQQKERLVIQRAEAAAAWENAQTRLKQVQAEIAEVSSEILSPAQEQELLELGSQRDHAEKLRQELTDLLAEQKAIETSLAAIDGLKGKCPACGQPVSEEVKTKDRKALCERLSELDGLSQGTKEELNDLAEIGTAISRLEGHHKALVRRAKLTEEQSNLQAVQPPNGSDLESRMTMLVERINKGERVLEKAQQSENATARWETYAREKSDLETKMGLLDRLTDFFGPSGAMMAQAASRMGLFTESLNQHLAAFGYSCNLSLEPFEIRVLSSQDSRPDLPLAQLSESERFRFSIAFQIALATVTGIRFVVIDRADVLDKERRKLFTGMLLHSDVDQAIVLATGEEPPPRAIPPGVKFFDLATVQEPEKERMVKQTSVTAIQARLLPQHNEPHAAAADNSSDLHH
jgi:DNA repair exonuclease SbcCD ATPase subunit